MSSLSLLVFGSALFAQAQPSTPEPAAESPPSVEQALQAAGTALDRLEAGVDDATARALLDTVSAQLQSVQDREPGNARLPFLSGRVYALLGRSGDAIDQLRRFVESPQGRNEWKAYRILGDLFVTEFPRLAKANYEQAAKLNPSEPALVFGLSLCAFKLGAMDDAVRLAQEAVTADGRKTVRYLAHLANLYQNQQKWDDAIREGEEALRLASEAVQADPAGDRALVTADQQYQQVISILQIAVRQSDEVTAAWHLRLADYIRQRAALAGRLALRDAVSVLADGVERAGSNPPVALLERYASSLAELGRVTEAIAAYERLLEVDAGNAAATEALAQLRASGP